VEKEGVVIHEIGHALKLEHPIIDVWSIMQLMAESSYYVDYMTVYDIYSLKSKWGV